MRLRFWAKTPHERATELYERHTARVVCSNCGEGALAGIPSALVRLDVVRPGPDGHKRNRAKDAGQYVHRNPRACAFVIERARVWALRQTWWQRVLRRVWAIA